MVMINMMMIMKMIVTHSRLVIPVRHFALLLRFYTRQFCVTDQRRDQRMDQQTDRQTHRLIDMRWTHLNSVFQAFEKISFDHLSKSQIHAQSSFIFSTSNALPSFFFCGCLITGFECKIFEIGT